MFSRPKRVRRYPYSSYIYEPQPPIQMDEARLQAWAFSIGERHGGCAAERKPHRGQLPDVDLSQGVAVAPRPGAVMRLFRRIFARRAGSDNEAEPPGRTEDAHAALGESVRKPYVWVIDADATAAESVRPEPAGREVTYEDSRAA